jgi:hypothetical protein
MTYPREKVVKFIVDQLANKKDKPVGGTHHYGKQELRDLLDFIYGGEPLWEGEELK